MLIRVNGEMKEVAEGATVEGLLSALGIRPFGMALELNREIIPKRLYGSTVLNEGDVIEIVRMVGGG